MPQLHIPHVVHRPTARRICLVTSQRGSQAERNKIRHLKIFITVTSHPMPNNTFKKRR